jgi:hypothetical protein
LLGPGPGITDDTPLYNDVQCGNGPPNDAGDEHTCPGRVDIGSEGCGHVGPRWNFAPEEEVKPPVVVCFPGDATVEVKNKGVIRMEELQLRDEVLVNVNPNKFDVVYAFGHRNPDVEVLGYLQFLPTGLEVSNDHMVHLAGPEDRIVPASMVAVGDTLLQSSELRENQAVDEIRTVTGRGAYAPFTMSGTIVVNDVVASCYISMQRDSEMLITGDLGTTSITHHWLAHMSQAWSRIYVRFFGYDVLQTNAETGVNWWVNLSYELSNQFLMHQESGIIAVASLVFVLPSLLVGSALETGFGCLLGWY